MAYLEQRSMGNRGGMLVAAAALNGLVILGLVTAFNGIPFREIVDPHIRTWNEPRETVVPIEQPSPKPHQPAGDVRQIDRQDNEVFIDFGLRTEPWVLPPLDPPGGGGMVIEPPKQPTFAPKGAVALGNPGAWATEADYPGAELRAGHAGTTRFRLSIGTDGRVSDCSVTVSSGWPGLDAATCQLVSVRARFRPATDGNGAVTAGTFASAIRWVIPG